MIRPIACVMGRLTEGRYVSTLERLLSRYGRQTRVGERLKVLDVGAGNCWLLSRLSGEYDRVGVDIATNLHGIEDRRVSLTNVGRLQFVYGDGMRLPFRDASFDCVYSNEFVSHVGDVDQTLSEQIRVLKSGGFLVIMDANILNPVTFVDLFVVDYLMSLGSGQRRGGMKWLLHRGEPAFQLAWTVGARELMIDWRDENIHSQYYWRKKLRSWSREVDFSVSTFWSYLPFTFFGVIANKVLVVGVKR